MLTSWPMEDLVSPLNGINPSNGELFDMLEAAVLDHAHASGRRRITCAHLRKRCQPKRPPPRVLVFTGPAGAAKRAVMAGLVASHPNLFARAVTHTTRRPREHEVDGTDYCFTDAPEMRCDLDHIWHNLHVLPAQLQNSTSSCLHAQHFVYKCKSPQQVFGLMSAYLLPSAVTQCGEVLHTQVGTLCLFCRPGWYIMSVS